MHLFKFFGIGKIISGWLMIAFFLIFLKSAKENVGNKYIDRKIIKIFLMNYFILSTLLIFSNDLLNSSIFSLRAKFEIAYTAMSKKTNGIAVITEA